MARAPDERIEQAKAMYLNGQKLVEIAKQLNLPEGTVRRWKCTNKWESERSEKNSERSKRKRGAQPGNKNSAGGPVGNTKAEKFGFFRKYLPGETVSIDRGDAERPIGYPLGSNPNRLRRHYSGADDYVCKRSERQDDRKGWGEIWESFGGRMGSPARLG